MNSEREIIQYDDGVMLGLWTIHCAICHGPLVEDYREHEIKHHQSVDII